MERLAFCHECGHRNALSTQFCTKCGTQLEPDEAQGPQDETGARRRRWMVIGVSGAVGLALAAWLLPGLNRTVSREATGASSEAPGLLARVRAIGGVPEAIKREVFENARFRAPLLLPLPRELTPDQERWYTGALRTSFLPPIPPVGQVEEIQPEEFRDFLQSAELIRIFEMPSRIGTAPLQYFRYTDKAGPHTLAQGASRALRLAERELVSVDYTNQYKINPAGMGERDVFALTFSYRLASKLPRTSPVPQTYRAQARVLSNPDTGQWQLESLGLEDPQPIEYLRLAAPDIFAAFRKQQAIQAEKAAQAERARQEAERIRRETEEQARIAQERLERERRQAEQEAERARREREQAAKQPTRVIASHEFKRTFGGPIVLEITDTNVVEFTRANPGSKKTIGYWDVEAFQVWGNHLAYNPNGRPKFVLETLVINGLVPDPGAVVSELVEAHRAWTARFPDRVNWYPSK